MNFLKLRHQNMKNYNANPRPYGRGFFSLVEFAILPNNFDI